MFRALGALLAVYTVFAIFRGEVYAKSGPGGKTVDRTTAPGYFWVVIAIYLGLAAALIFVC